MGQKTSMAVLAVILVFTMVLNFGPVIGVSDNANAALTLAGGIVFTIIHGGLALGWKRIAIFLGVTVAVSFTSEALGVATGLIFGNYYYTDNLGPKILGVPPMIQAGYVTMSYASLITARAALGALATPRGWHFVGVAVAAAWVMVSWDVVMDPYQATLEGDWIWRDSGPYFGIPLHNYAGWFGTVVVFLLIYLAYERAHPLPPPAGLRANPWFWGAPVLYYGVMAFGIVIAPLVGGADGPANALSKYPGSPYLLGQSMSLIGTFVMGLPVVFALVRLTQWNTPAPGKLGTAN